MGRVRTSLQGAADLDVVAFSDEMTHLQDQVLSLSLDDPHRADWLGQIRSAVEETILRLQEDAELAGSEAERHHLMVQSVLLMEINAGQ